MKKNHHHVFFKYTLIRKIFSYAILIDTICITFTTFFCYFIIWPKLQATSIQKAEVSMNQIAGQIDDFTTSARDSAQYVVSSTELKQLIAKYHDNPTAQTQSQICLSLANLSSTIANIKSIVMISEDSTFTSITNLSDSDYSFIEKDRKTQSTSSYFTSIYEYQTQPSAFAIGYFYTYTIDGTSYRFYFFFKATTLVSTLNNLYTNDLDGISLYDNNSGLFYQNGKTGNSTLLFEDKFTGTETEVLDDRDHYFFNSANLYSWTIVGYVSRQTLNSYISNIFFLTLLFCVFFSVISMLVIIIIVRRFISPINSLYDTMQLVSEGNFSVHSTIHSGDEIEELGKIFNRMIDKINSYIDEQIQYETREQRMKYNLLIAQIDSHFICNTMTVINSMARNNMNQELIQANSALIKIVQNCLRVKTFAITDTIRQEVDILNQYLVIEKLRYKNHATVTTDIPEDLLDYEIPKNILQPLVENCFFHGLMDYETNCIEGTVLLTIRKIDTNLRIIIKDNGCGLTESQLYAFNHLKECIDPNRERGKHIGIQNIQKRLDFIYHDKASLVFENDNGCKITICFPISSKEENGGKDNPNTINKSSSYRKDK